VDTPSTTSSAATELYGIPKTISVTTQAPSKVVEVKAETPEQQAIRQMFREEMGKAIMAEVPMVKEEMGEDLMDKAVMVDYLTANMVKEEMEEVRMDKATTVEYLTDNMVNGEMVEADRTVKAEMEEDRVDKAAMVECQMNKMVKKETVVKGTAVHLSLGGKLEKVSIVTFLF